MNEVSREKIIVRTSIIGIIANVFLAGFKSERNLPERNLTRSIPLATAG